MDTRDDPRPDEFSPDELSPDELSPDELSPDELSPDELRPDELCPDELSPDDLGPDDLSLLSWADEVRLARVVEAGVLARCQRELATRSVDASVAELLALERLGLAAQRRMVAANLRLVSLVVARMSRFPELVRTDLFQDGCVGLIEAVRRFDHTRGHRFATYALIRIRAAVIESAFRAQASGGLTSARLREQRRLRFVETELSQRLGRTATLRDVAAAAGRETGWVAALIGHEVAVPIETVADELVEVAPPADPRELVGLSAALLERLGATHRQVLELRYGFGPGSRAHSLRDIAAILGVTLGTARRLEKDGLDALRSRCPYDARALL